MEWRRRSISGGWFDVADGGQEQSSSARGRHRPSLSPVARRHAVDVLQLAAGRLSADFTRRCPSYVLPVETTANVERPA